MCNAVAPASASTSITALQSPSADFHMQYPYGKCLVVSIDPKTRVTQSVMAVQEDRPEAEQSLRKRSHVHREDCNIPQLPARRGKGNCSFWATCHVHASDDLQQIVICGELEKRCRCPIYICICVGATPRPHRFVSADSTVLCCAVSA